LDAVRIKLGRVRPLEQAEGHATDSISLKTSPKCSFLLLRTSMNHRAASASARKRHEEALLSLHRYFIP